MARENMVGTSVRVPRSVLERLERVADRSRWSKGEIHRQALEFYLGVMESGHYLAGWSPVDQEGELPEEEPDMSEEEPDMSDEEFYSLGDTLISTAVASVTERGHLLLVAMRKIEPGADRGALVAFRELRQAITGLTKAQFDQEVIGLAVAGRVSLHRHDHVGRLTDAQRADLVKGSGQDYFIGAAIRGQP